MEVFVQSGQTLADIAIQEYGCLEAVVRLALDNNKSVSDNLESGETIVANPYTYNKVLASYCKINGVAPATDYQENAPRREGVFSLAFNSVFK